MDDRRMRSHIDQVLRCFESSDSRRWAKRAAFSTATAGLLALGQGACPTTTPAGPSQAPPSLSVPTSPDPDIHAEYAVDPDWKRQVKPAYAVDEVRLHPGDTAGLVSGARSHMDKTLMAKQPATASPGAVHQPVAADRLE
jgi:hypothetical protein